MWFSPAVSPNGEEYFYCYFMYSDYFLEIRKYPKVIMYKANTELKLKRDVVEEPTVANVEDACRTLW